MCRSCSPCAMRCVCHHHARRGISPTTPHGVLRTRLNAPSHNDIAQHHHPLLPPLLPQTRVAVCEPPSPARNIAHGGRPGAHDRRTTTRRRVGEIVTAATTSSGTAASTARGRGHGAGVGGVAGLEGGGVAVGAGFPVHVSCMAISGGIIAAAAGERRDLSALGLLNSVCGACVVFVDLSRHSYSVICVVRCCPPADCMVVYRPRYYIFNSVLCGSFVVLREVHPIAIMSV